MSLSVNGSNNPFSYLQSLWQQSSPASGSQSDQLSALLAAVDQGTGSASSPSVPASAGVPSGGTASMFGPQTLQTLLALQANGSNSQSLLSQFADAAGGADPLSVLQSGQSQGHHHHHHHMGSGSTDANGGAVGADTSSASAGNAGATGGASNPISGNIAEQWGPLPPQQSTGAA